MKIVELLEGKQMKDIDPDAEPVVKSADEDETPHIFMQLRKAVDVDGNYPIKFKDGTSKKLGLDVIGAFVKKYMTAKPDEKEAMQHRAGESLKDFMAVLSAPEKPKLDQKIKGSRYMSHFAGDFDDK